MKQFHHAGVSLAYPEDWTFEPEDHDDGWGLSLYSPGSAFLTVRCHRSTPTVEELAEAALAVMRGEYPDLEAEPRVESLGGQMALGHDMQFISVDLTNTAWTRALYSDAGTLLFLCQTTDRDPGHYEPVLRAILLSLRIDEAEE